MDRHRIKEVRDDLLQRKGHLRVGAIEATQTYEAVNEAVSLCDELLGETHSGEDEGPSHE